MPTEAPLLPHCAPLATESRSPSVPSSCSPAGTPLQQPAAAAAADDSRPKRKRVRITKAARAQAQLAASDAQTQAMARALKQLAADNAALSAEAAFLRMPEARRLLSRPAPVVTWVRVVQMLIERL